MSVSFELAAEVRTNVGKGTSRRLRKENKIPAVIYGAGKPPVSLTLEHNKLVHNLENEAFYSKILDVNVEGKTEQAVLKDLQRHPYKAVVLHIDLLRINAKEKLKMNVPLHFEGGDIAPGVKMSGGVFSHLMTEVEIACLPKHLPEYISVDVSKMEAGESLHLTDIKLGPGIEIVALTHGEDHNLPIVSLHLPRAAVEEATTEVESEAEAESDSEDKKD